MALGPRDVMPGGSASTPPPPNEASPRPMPFTPVSFAVIGVSVVVFALGLLNPSVNQWGALYGPYVRAGDWYRVGSFLFTHGGIIHIVFNMSTVWTLGRVLELNIGSLRFLLVSAITGVGSAVFVMWLNPTVPTVGASGMILGWLGAMLPLANKAGRSQLLMVLAQVAVISFLPGVSWAGHLGGVAFGLACGFALRAGPSFFRAAAPVLVFAAAVLTVLLGTGRLGSL